MNTIATSQAQGSDFPEFDVSDDFLEGSGGAAAPLVEYTYYGCTNYGYCPGY